MFKLSRYMGLSIAIVLSLSGAAMARERDSSYNARQYAYQAGYQDGIRYGEDARAQGYRYDYKNSEDYRRADRGYDPSMGEHDDFQKSYRNGYKSGYDDGFNGRRNSQYYGYGQGPGNYGYDPNSRDPRNGPYRDNGNGYENGYGNGRYGFNGGARDFGYRDGTIMGEKDRRNGKDFRPEKNESYEHADHGYRREFGNKNYYKAEYRRAFVQGYEEAYGR